MEFNYKEIAYLIGCYAIIEDKEINSRELSVLNDFLPLQKDSLLYAERKKIFQDDETKIPLRELLNKLSHLHLNKEKSEELVHFLVCISYADFYMDSKERNLVERVAKILNVPFAPIAESEASNNSKNISDSKLKWHESLWGRVENFTYGLSDKNEKRTDKILGGLGFADILEEVTEEASTDMERVSGILNTINDDLKTCAQGLNQFSFAKNKSRKDFDKIKETIAEISKEFNQTINESVSQNIELLDKKKRNIHYFTIAFMGRTKAGKSTLHKVVTQQNDDDIGIGKLRTTRYNRSWYWDRLRIVDTPGIGAPGGEVDTEIAKSIIDEADMICYIVTSDSIQETEFDFFETIKDRNKPLYIILNYKSNLSGIRLKKFLENSTVWKDCKGPQSIEGHFKRIEERLSGKYNMDAVAIIPLHLLAAQLYVEGGFDAETLEKLKTGSNIASFIRTIKEEIYNTGCLKKSLSIIDGSSYNIHQVNARIKADCDRLREDVSLLEKTREKISSFFSNERGKLTSQLSSITDSVRQELKNRANTFSNENYDNENAGAAWENDYVVKSILERYKERISDCIEDFKSKLKSELEEVTSDLQIHFRFASFQNIKGASISNTRLGAGIFGSILTAAAPFIISQLWHPGGWIAAAGTAVVGVIVTLFTRLFTSKSEKIRKAIDKMREQLEKGIDENMSKNKSALLVNINSSINSASQEINGAFVAYITGANDILNEMDALLKKCNESESAINSLIGFRILDYVRKNKVKDKKIKDMTNEFLIENYPVERDWANHSLTYKYANACNENDKMKAEKATQMTINFK